MNVKAWFEPSIAEFSRKSSFETVVRFFNVISSLYLGEELRARINDIKGSYNRVVKLLFLLNVVR